MTPELMFRQSPEYQTQKSWTHSHLDKPNSSHEDGEVPTSFIGISPECLLALCRMLKYPFTESQLDRIEQRLGHDIRPLRETVKDL